MRQVGSFPQQSTANRFASYLVTQGIHAQAEDDGGGWSVWVREEDQLQIAREALAQFTADPEHARYQDVERAVLPEDRLRGALHRGQVGQIEQQEARLGQWAAGADALQHRAGPVLRAGGQDDAPPTDGQRLGQGPADARVGAGDEERAAGERSGQGLKRSCSRSTARLRVPRVTRAWKTPFTPTFAPWGGGLLPSETTVSVPVSSFS